VCIFAVRFEDETYFIPRVALGIAVEISRFLENKASAVAFLNRELGTDSPTLVVTPKISNNE
jgi:hypothetical protein